MAMEFIRETNGWWELDRENLRARNYMGGHHYITRAFLDNAEIFKCENWHELYLAKHFCPFESDTSERSGWISPDGKIYEASAHEVTAEYLLDIIYGKESNWAGDELSLRGWVRVTTSLMWDIRLEEWKGRTLPQKQLDTLWEWCSLHKMKFPYDYKEVNQ